MIIFENNYMFEGSHFLFRIEKKMGIHVWTELLFNFPSLRLQWVQKLIDKEFRFVFLCFFLPINLHSYASILLVSPVRISKKWRNRQKNSKWLNQSFSSAPNAADGRCKFHFENIFFLFFVSVAFFEDTEAFGLLLNVWCFRYRIDDVPNEIGPKMIICFYSCVDIDQSWCVSFRTFRDVQPIPLINYTLVFYE